MISQTGLQVGVLGTGLPALAAAHFLQNAGHTATVLDTGQGFVRLGRTFPYGGGRFDQFLQVVRANDHELLALSKALGIQSQLQWHASPRKQMFWPLRREPKVATSVGFSQALELVLRNRLNVNQVGKALDLLEFDHCIEIRTDSGRRQFDAMITTLTLDEVEDMAKGLIAQDLPRSQARHRTLVNVVFLTETPLLKKHATFVENAQLPFTEVSSMTNVESRLSCINVSGYSDASDTELRLLALQLLSEKFAEFQPSNVEAIQVFRSEELIPVYTIGDAYLPIAERVGDGRLFLASRELGGSMPVSMNTDIVLARNAVNSFLECAPTFACGARQAEHAAAR